MQTRRVLIKLNTRISYDYERYCARVSSVQSIRRAYADMNQVYDSQLN